MLQYLAKDPATDVILGYIENVSNGQEFVRQARLMTHKKPVLMIKSGISAAGAKAASSHTGAIAGSDQAYNAAFEKSGIIRVNDVSTLFTLAQSFSSQPLPHGPNVAIVTNSGGPGIMAADACDKSGLQLAKLSEATVRTMQDSLPSFASLYNPIDILGDADAQRYQKTLEIVVQDANIDALLIVLTPTASIVAEIEAATESIINTSHATSKPVLACLMGEKAIKQGIQKLQSAGVPCYSFPEPAVQSLEALYAYAQWQQKKDEELEYFLVNKDEAQEVILAAQEKHKDSEYIEIVEFQAQKLLKAYALPTPQTALAHTSQEAMQQAQKIGFPVVLKIASVDISHKSDVKGVQVGLHNEQEVQQAFTEITSRAIRLRPKAHITGCLVQKMAPKGVKEVIVGFKRDEQFGPLLMFGLGGIYVEVLKDISFKLAPITRSEANEMIRQIKSYLLLKGIRGETAVNIRAIEDILLKLSQLSMDFPDISEAECNPVLVNEEEAVVADVRLTLSNE
jgi:acetyltransferase